jgi:hypothetical protein
MAAVGTHHGTHFEFLEGCSSHFGNVTKSEVGHVRDVYIPQTAIFGEPHIANHEDNFEDIQQIVICGIGVEISNDYDTVALLC